MQFRLNIKNRTLRYTLLALLTIFSAVTLLTARYFFVPDIKKLKQHNPKKTSFIIYREHQWKKRHTPHKAGITWVPLATISDNLICAVIASEDATFYKHHGFDYAAMRYAMQENLELKTIKYGASTITQQLVKNLYFNPSKNFLRKLNEAILTWRIERTLSKKRILEIYLNVIEWGDGIFGIEQAARHYYHKSASDLTAHEAATLAAVLPSPLRYNPLSSSKFMTRRTNSILSKMGRRDVPIQQPAPAAAIVPAEVQTERLNDTSNITTTVDIPDTL